MSPSQEDTDTPYIPERYRVQIREKERHRLIRKLVFAFFVIGVVGTATFVLGPMLTGAPENHPGTPASPPDSTQAPSVTVTLTTMPVNQPTVPATNLESSSQIPPTIVAPGTTMVSRNEPVISSGALKAQQTPGVLLIDRVTKYLREDYPASSYRLVSVDVTDTTSGHKLWLFSIKPAGSASGDPSTTVQMDANTGDIYTPAQESAKVSSQGAKKIAGDTFAGLHPDRISVRFIAGAGAPAAWNFSLYTGDSIILSGSLDPETGQITSFSRNLDPAGRPDAPAIDIVAAQKIADSYIAEKNGPVSVNLSMADYIQLGTPDSPRAGQYMFRYNRVVQGYPCDIDGLSLAIDSITGEVTRYARTWNTPEYAFSPSPQPVVLRRDATYDVLKKAQDTYPGLSPGVQVLSADLRWKDDHPANIVPRPGSIPLAWKVVFDDELMRKQPGSGPAVAWIDAQSGSMLAFVYRHEQPGNNPR